MIIFWLGVSQYNEDLGLSNDDNSLLYGAILFLSLWLALNAWIIYEKIVKPYYKHSRSIASADKVLLFKEISGIKKYPTRKHIKLARDKSRKTNCYFHAYYFDYEKDIVQLYQCGEAAGGESGYCKFHDSNIHLQPSEVQDYIKRSIENETPLFCIGFRMLSPLDLSNYRFNMPIYFCNSQFGKVNFSQCFFKSANFAGCSFEEVNFADAIFTGNVHFVECVFRSKEEYSGSRIISLGLVNFEDVKFFGDVDFSYSLLCGTCRFDKAIFSKGAFFYKTTFRIDSISTFLQTDFKGDSNFSGSTINSNVLILTSGGA